MQISLSVVRRDKHPSNCRSPR